MIQNQLARRNLTDSQRRYFIGKRYEEEKKQGERTDLTSGQSDQKSISEIIVEETGISDSTVRRNANYSKAIDEIKKHQPEVAEKLMTI